MSLMGAVQTLGSFVSLHPPHCSSLSRSAKHDRSESSSGSGDESEASSSSSSSSSSSDSSSSSESESEGERDKDEEEEEEENNEDGTVCCVCFSGKSLAVNPILFCESCSK